MNKTKSVSIYEQLKQTLMKRKNELISPQELKKELFKRYGTNPNSVILSDYCYNRLNKGITFKNHLFIYLNRGMYKYIGENAPYSGFIYAYSKILGADQVVGSWVDGQASLSSNSSSELFENEKKIADDQLIKLFEEYMEILKFEMTVLGCAPTELRHLIGRIGEFFCAIHTKGRLAHVTNQHGFDVMSNNRRISVKTTAQQSGFVSLNINTLSEFDDIFVVQYFDGDFKILFYAPKEQLPNGRMYNNRLEISIALLKATMKKLHDGDIG